LGAAQLHAAVLAVFTLAMLDALSTTHALGAGLTAASATELSAAPAGGFVGGRRHEWQHFTLSGSAQGRPSAPARRGSSDAHAL